MESRVAATILVELTPSIVIFVISEIAEKFTPSILSLILYNGIVAELRVKVVVVGAYNIRVKSVVLEAEYSEFPEEVEYNSTSVNAVGRGRA
jgi:hypothetical protein